MNTSEKLIKETQDVQIIALKDQVRHLLTTVGNLQQETGILRQENGIFRQVINNSLLILRQAIDNSSLMGKKTKSRTKSTRKRNC